VTLPGLVPYVRRDFPRAVPKSLLRDFIAAAQCRLQHRLGEYNAAQRVF